MVDKEKRDVSINRNAYHITIAESWCRWRVSVYEKTFGLYHKSDAICTNTSWKGIINKTNVEKLVQQTLNEAVCIHEQKIDMQKRFESKINQSIEQVKQAHE